MINNIENLKTFELKESNFIKPLKVEFDLNGVPKTWEAVRSHDSVSILLFHKEKNAFLFVKQFRIPVYLNDKNITYTYELCAGLVDKDVSLEQIAIEEIDEECGYNVELENLQKITSFYTNVGISGSKQHLYFAIIDENQKVHQGGGINDEQIELEFMNIDFCEEFIFDETKAKTPGLMFAVFWFLRNRKDLGL